MSIQALKEQQTIREANTMILNLDPEFTPCGPGIKYDQFFFSGGEAHIKLVDTIPCREQCTITTRLNNGNDIMMLLVATDALRRSGVGQIDVFIPYLPYARQDRVMVHGEPLSLRVFADLINSQKYDSVTTFDVHSDVAGALINNFFNVSNHELVNFIQKDKFLLVSPDAGALKKIYKLAEFLQYKDEIVICNKIRDVSNGQIKGVSIQPINSNAEGKDLYVVDDICDGGRSFIEIAKELRKMGVTNKINLVVSHGIFSAGLKPLFESGIDHIYTTDSIQSYTTVDGYSETGELIDIFFGVSQQDVNKITQIKLDSCILR